NPDDEPRGRAGPFPPGAGHRPGSADAAATSDHGHRRTNREHALHPHGNPRRLSRDGARAGRDRSRSFAHRECGPARTGARRRPPRRASTRPKRRTRMKTFVITLTALALIPTARGGELELVQTIPLKGKAGNLDHLALDTKRDRLLVANKANDTLDVVDL